MIFKQVPLNVILQLWNELLGKDRLPLIYTHICILASFRQKINIGLFIYALTQQQFSYDQTSN